MTIIETSGSSDSPAIMFNLTICGATDPDRDGSVFSDFMGYSMALRDAGVAGDFYSCFPLDLHFRYLQKTYKTDLVKFGTTGQDGKGCIYSYSRFQFDARERWFEDIPTQDIRQRVLDWISEKSKAAKPGDTVNIFLESHGNRKGIQLGDNLLSFRDIHTTLDAFAKKVQINLITGCCYSGRTVALLAQTSRENRYYLSASKASEKTPIGSRSVSNRIRNANFSHAFVQSLARISLPNRPRQRTIWRIDDLEQFMTDQLVTNLSPSECFTSLYTAPVDGLSAVEDMIFKRKIDVVYNPAIASRRRRIEWPTLDNNLAKIYTPSGVYSDRNVRPISPATKSLLDEEISKCNTRRSAAGDEHVFDHIYFATPDYFPILQNLYWRARRQSTIWDCFVQLVLCGLVNPQCLEQSVSVTGLEVSNDDLDTVEMLLLGFQNLQRDMHMADHGQIAAQNMSYSRDIRWLATMIVRGGRDLVEILIKLVQTGYLGSLEEDSLLEVLEEHGGTLPEIKFDLKTLPVDPSKCKHPSFEFDNSFGFILPHGLGSLVGSDASQHLANARDFLTRFNMIEETYRLETGLSREELLLEFEQANYYEQYPDKLPVNNYDRADITVVKEYSRD